MAVEQNLNVESVSAPPLVGAGFWIRALARTIDMVVHYLIWLAGPFLLVIGYAIAKAPSQAALQGFVKAIGTPRWHGYIAALIGMVLYHAIMEMRGATVGKRLLGLVVVRADLTRAGFGATFRRSLAICLDGVLFGAVAYGAMEPPLQQRLGDKWGQTIVTTRASLASQFEREASFGWALCWGVLADGLCFLISVSLELA